MNRKLRRRVSKQKLEIILLVILLQIIFPQHVSAQTTKLSVDGELIRANDQNVAVNHLPVNKQKPAKKSVWLTVTAYSSTPDQTSGDPFITASGERVRDGIIAHNFLPFGTKVRFPDVYGDKVFTVKDRLHERYGYYMADMWMETREEAIQWGAKIIKMEIL
ncbi:MAG: hypothetical protein V1838_04580 [Patescibacteria group bacterium]